MQIRHNAFSQTGCLMDVVSLKAEVNVDDHAGSLPGLPTFISTSSLICHTNMHTQYCYFYANDQSHSTR